MVPQKMTSDICKTKQNKTKQKINISEFNQLKRVD